MSKEQRQVVDEIHKILKTSDLKRDINIHFNDSVAMDDEPDENVIGSIRNFLKEDKNPLTKAQEITYELAEEEHQKELLHIITRNFTALEIQRLYDYIV
jgi:CO dehydrogenase/acetyl-CoA synthase beta subunit